MVASHVVPITDNRSPITVTSNYSSSFLAAFLVAFLAGFSSASIEALRSASTLRSPSVVFSTFGRSSCGS